MAAEQGEVVAEAGGGGYIASLVGAYLGGGLVGVGGVAIGITIAEATESGFDELGSALGYGAWGLFLGILIGAPLGCFIALRVRKHHGALGTALALAAIIGFGFLFWEVALETAGELLGQILPVTGLFVSPLVARALSGGR